MKSAKITISKSDRSRLSEVNRALEQAQDAYVRISEEARLKFEEQHSPNSTLGYCLRWGKTVSAELIEDTTPQLEPSIWVTPAQLASHLRIKLDLIKRLTQEKILVLWEREGEKYYDLKESQTRYKTWVG